MRTREQNGLREEAGPSGRTHSPGSNAKPVGILYQHERTIRRRDRNHDGRHFVEENGELVPLVQGRYLSAIVNENTVIGMIIDGFVRPIFNADHKIVILEENGRYERVVSLARAEKLGVNRHVSEQYGSRPV